MSQPVSLDSNTRLVSIVYFVYSTTRWKTTRLRLETSVRLTVTVYSPTRELTVDRFSTGIGWKLVEKSFVEIAHDRKENPIFISVVEAFPLITRPCFLGTSTWVQSQSLKEKTFVSLGLIRLGTVAKKFAWVQLPKSLPGTVAGYRVYCLFRSYSEYSRNTTFGPIGILTLSIPPRCP